MTPSIIFNYECINAAAICVAWLLALPLGISFTSSLAGVQDNSRNNVVPPRI